MKFDRRSFVAAAFALGAAVAMPAFAQNAPYTPITPAQPTEDASKIEVVAKQQGDVVVKKVPITFGRAAWANIAKLYYTLEITGDLQRLEGDVFKAIHVERQNLFEERALTEWVVKKGVDAKKFSETFNSFGVMSKVKRGDQMAQAYKIQGVPALAVEGKFLIGGKDFNDTLAIADSLITKARSEKSGKAPAKK